MEVSKVRDLRRKDCSGVYTVYDDQDPNVKLLVTKSHYRLGCTTSVRDEVTLVVDGDGPEALRETCYPDLARKVLPTGLGQTGGPSTTSLVVEDAGPTSRHRTTDTEAPEIQ